MYICMHVYVSFIDMYLCCRVEEVQILRMCFLHGCTTRIPAARHKLLITFVGIVAIAMLISVLFLFDRLIILHDTTLIMAWCDTSCHDHVILHHIFGSGDIVSSEWTWHGKIIK